LKIKIFITTSFEGFHRWAKAPKRFAYLASRHRHIFHVRAEKVVTHDDRDIEFINLKNQINEAIAGMKNSSKVETYSCERWAKELLRLFDLSRCEVSEDGENGAIVER
jgi:hypothetical protein